MKKLCWLLFTCWTIAQVCQGQQPRFDITVRQLSLPGSFNRDLLQVARDDEGFTWFINNEGLWRFDGSDVKLIDITAFKLSQNLSAYNLYCHGHFLILCIPNGNVHVYNKLTGQCNIEHVSGPVTNIAERSDGTASIFTATGAVYGFSEGGSLRVQIDLNRYKGWEPDMMLDRGLIDETGNVYLFLKSRVGLLRKDSVSWTATVSTAIPKKSADYDIIGCAATSEFIAVQYVNDQLALYSKKTLAPIAFFSKQVSAACIAINNRLVLLPNSDSVKIPSEMLPFFYIRKGVFKDFARVFAVLAYKGRPWLIGTTSGMFELSQHAIAGNLNYDQQKAVSFFSDKSVRCVYQMDHKLYVGTYSGLFVCTADTIRPIRNGWAYTLRPASPHTMLVGMEGGSGFGLLDCRTDSFTVVPNPDSQPQMYTTALFKDNTSWLAGNYKTLDRVNIEHGNFTRKVVNADSSLGTFRQISNINGTIYIACRQGVFRVDADDALHKIYPHNASLLVYAMQDAPDGIWLGTHGKGLVKIDYNGNELQQIGFNEGLASNFVYSLGMMDDLLVAGTGAGVSTFDIKSNMEPIAFNGDIKTNGISNEECNHSALYYDTSGKKMIVGGVQGLIFVDKPDRKKNSGANDIPITLSYVKTGMHETNSASANLFAYAKDEIRVSADDRSLTLKFAAPADDRQEEGLFRIKELSEKWQRLKIAQEINFYALPPGRYTLQARLPSSIDEKTWFTRSLVIEPAFYQTGWFIALVALAVLCVACLLWRFQLNKINREQRLRTTIASDLHDDIGSTLNSISVYTEIAKRQIGPDKNDTGLLLEKMGAASRDMIDRMSDIVWTINPRNDDFEQVLKRMHFFAGELLSGKNILLHFNVDEKARKLKLTMQQRKNIYLIYKEAIHNSYKYSGATEVSVHIKRTSDKLHMLIADNGVGFDSHEKAGKGNGLINMKQRADEINATFNIKANAEGGTLISFTIQA